MVVLKVQSRLRATAIMCSINFNINERFLLVTFSLFIWNKKETCFQSTLLPLSKILREQLCMVKQWTQIYQPLLGHPWRHPTFSAMTTQQFHAISRTHCPLSSFISVTRRSSRFLLPLITCLLIPHSLSSLLFLNLASRSLLASVLILNISHLELIISWIL